MFCIILSFLLAMWVLCILRLTLRLIKLDGVFLGYAFGFRSHEIPIAAITHIGIRGTFLGATTGDDHHVSQAERKRSDSQVGVETKLRQGSISQSHGCNC